MIDLTFQMEVILKSYPVFYEKIVGILSVYDWLLQDNFYTTTLKVWKWRLQHDSTMHLPILKLCYFIKRDNMHFILMEFSFRVVEAENWYHIRMWTFG